MSAPQENFVQWLDENYSQFSPAEPAGDGGPDWVCRRCGARVGYVTKHAVVRHGDGIEVMPVKNSNVELAEAF